jgi:hypothetical protein
MARDTRSSEPMLFVAAALALLAGCQEPVPGEPTYTVEMKPLFEAHCVRCHGGGGMINSDPEAGIFATDKGNSHLNVYGMTGACTADAGAALGPCVLGAQWSAMTGLMKAYLHGSGTIHMPPAPAEPLTDWELSLVDRWLANGYPE